MASIPLPRRFVAGLLGLIVCASACGSAADEPSVAAADEAPATPAPSATAVPEPTATPLPVPTLEPIDAPEPIPPVAPDGMELVWSDEFDGDEIDITNWGFDIGGWGWGNGEAQYYTDRPENARTENGLLVIELRKEPFDGSFYTSARLLTQDLREFQYGRIEARIKVPEGVGTWPAFWMLGSGFEQDAPDTENQWPFVGEIDIMEYVGREPDLLIGTVHGPGYAGAGGKSRWNRQEFPLYEDFHTYAIEWDEEGIRWFFDGEEYFDLGPENMGRREWVFDRPFFIILNLALGGTLGGVIDTDLEFPIGYYVDWVRVYQAVDQ